MLQYKTMHIIFLIIILTFGIFCEFKSSIVSKIILLWTILQALEIKSVALWGGAFCVVAHFVSTYVNVVHVNELDC